MLSLYIHIPFCLHKCNFCSFHVIPEDKIDHDTIEQRKEAYLQHVLLKLETWKSLYHDTPVKTLHLWWGTPFQLGTERLEKIIDTVLEEWDVEYLEELTIELNPDPIDEVLAFVKHCRDKYKKLYKLRFSFGIQTLDDKLLTQSWRNYNYEQLMSFFRSLKDIRKHYTLNYNADFIAFGTQQVDPEQEVFLRNVFKAKLFDTVSLYTLELFPGSQWWNESQHLTSSKSPIRWTDDQIMDEFEWYRDLLSQGRYHRYEISNFEQMGKRSSHNMTYRTMWSYIGIGPSASSFLTGKELEVFNQSKQIPEYEKLDSTIWLRRKNTLNRNQWIETSTLTLGTEIETLNSDQLDYEKAMLWLRTDHWIQNLSHYTPLLSSDAFAKIEERTEWWYCTYQNDCLKLTDLGMAVYNTLLTDLMK